MNDELLGFVVRAKAGTYASGGGLVVEAVDGQHQHTYAEGSWHYLDRYVGGSNFCGQEIVWRAATPVWAMVYSATLVRPDILDAGTAGQVIKSALSALYAQGRFLGGWSTRVSGWDYLDTNEGDVTSFTGVEEISRDDVVCYRLHYSGGLVNE